MHNIFIYIYIIYELLDRIMHKSNIISSSSYAYYESYSSSMHSNMHTRVL